MATAAERMRAMRARRRAAKVAPEPPKVPEEVRIAPISDLAAAQARILDLEDEVRRLKRLLADRNQPRRIVDPSFGHSRPAPKVRSLSR